MPPDYVKTVGHSPPKESIPIYLLLAAIRSAYSGASAGLMLPSLFDPKDGSYVSLRNVWLSELHGITTQNLPIICQFEFSSE